MLLIRRSRSRFLTDPYIQRTDNTVAYSPEGVKSPSSLGFWNCNKRLYVQNSIHRGLANLPDIDPTVPVVLAELKRVQAP